MRNWGGGCCTPDPHPIQGSGAAGRPSWVQHQRNELEHFSYPLIILNQVKNNKDISIASLDRSIYATLLEVIFRQQCNFKTKKLNIFV